MYINDVYFLLPKCRSIFFKVVYTSQKFNRLLNWLETCLLCYICENWNNYGKLTKLFVITCIFFKHSFSRNRMQCVDYVHGCTKFLNAFLLIHKNYWMEISNCYVLCVICLTEVTDNILWSIYIYICRSYKGL